MNELLLTKIRVINYTLKDFCLFLASGHPIILLASCRTKIVDIIAEGDKVCWRWVLRGKHTGVFQGMPATGKSIAIAGMSIVRLAEDRFVEHWGEQDMLGLMQQLRG